MLFLSAKSKGAGCYHCGPGPEVDYGRIIFEKKKIRAFA